MSICPLTATASIWLPTVMYLILSGPPRTVSHANRLPAHDEGNATCCPAMVITK
jgi:hypothetical protein